MSQYRVICVGVNAAPPGNCPLRVAEQDAEELSWVFRQLGYWDDDNNVCLTGNLATAQKIRNELDRLVTDPPQELLVLYWSGHMGLGPRTPQLATSPGRDGEAGTFPLSLLQEAFFLPQVTRNRILILDTCYSGIALRLTPRGARLLPDSARVIQIAACPTMGSAHETGFNGLFTGLLLTHLRNPVEPRATSLDLLEVFNAAAANAVSAGQPPLYSVSGPAPGHMRIRVLSQGSLPI